MLSTLFVVLTAIGGAAQAQSFSGTWTLDPARSVLWTGGAQQISLVILDDGESINVTDRRPSGDERYTCTSDGEPCEHKTANGGLFRRTVRREDGVLNWQIAMTRLADNASMQYTERWSVSEDGATLTVYTAYPGGREVLKVFSRKE